MEKAMEENLIDKRPFKQPRNNQQDHEPIMRRSKLVWVVFCSKNRCALKCLRTMVRKQFF